MNTISRAQSTFNKRVDDLEAVPVTFHTTTAEGRSAAARARFLPMAPTLAMKDGEFRVAMQHLLGLTPLPANAVGLR
jgi:hypothetical protein